MGTPEKERGSIGAARWMLAGLTAASLLVLGACDGRDGRSLVSVRDSAGIRIVDVALPGEQELVVPTHVADLMPPDEIFPATPWGVATDPASGRIYVADRFSDRVVVFDGSGAFNGAFGRSGEGPGEFGSPSALYFGTDGVLRVWDTGRGMISEWSADGEFLGEEGTSVPYWGPGFVAESDRLVTVISSGGVDGMGMNQQLVMQRGEDRSLLYELRLPMEMMELPCMTGPAPTIFGPSLTWASRGSRTFVHRSPHYQIEVFEGTTQVGSIRRSLPPISVTREMAEEAVEFGPTPYRSLLRACNVTPAQVVRAVGHEEEAPAVLALSVGPDDGVWVTRTEDGTNPSSVDVFGPDGVFKFSVDVPAAVVGFPSPTSFLTLRVDRDTGEALLSLYSLGGSVQQRAAQTAMARQLAPDDGRSGDDGDDPWTRPPPDAELEPLAEFRDCARCPRMVVVPPGRFIMGSPEGEGLNEVAERWHHLLDDERPQIEIEIDYPLAIGKFEVTFREWEQCRDAGGCERNPDSEGHGKGDRPVINVGRHDAEQYLAWLSQETGRAYRLPSESEWEYAARAGSSTSRYWGDEIGEGRATCIGCGGRSNQATAPVGSFPGNAFGLHDMLGNAREWTSDCYTPANNNRPTDGSPVREGSPYWEDGVCTVWVYRGGGWRSEPYQLRAAARRVYNTRGPWGTGGSSSTGFRVVRPLEAGAGAAGLAGRDASGPRR
jgi:formylglycine-generating enzyme required for sulfatase activity